MSRISHWNLTRRLLIHSCTFSRSDYEKRCGVHVEKKRIPCFTETILTNNIGAGINGNFTTEVT